MNRKLLELTLTVLLMCVALTCASCASYQRDKVGGHIFYHDLTLNDGIQYSQTLFLFSNGEFDLQIKAGDLDTYYLWIGNYSIDKNVLTLNCEDFIPLTQNYLRNTNLNVDKNWTTSSVEYYNNSYYFKTERNKLYLYSSKNAMKPHKIGDVEDCFGYSLTDFTMSEMNAGNQSPNRGL